MKVIVRIKFRNIFPLLRILRSQHAQKLFEFCGLPIIAFFIGVGFGDVKGVIKIIPLSDSKI